MTDTDPIAEALKEEINRSSRQNFLSTLAIIGMAILVIFGVAAYLFSDFKKKNAELLVYIKKIESQRDDLENKNRLLVKEKHELKELESIWEKESKENQKAKTLLSEILNLLSQRGGNIEKIDPNNELLFELADKRILALKNERGPTQSSAEKRREAVDNLLKVVQTASKTATPEGREDENRQWYSIKYEVVTDPPGATVNDNGETRIALDLVDRVEYRFDPRWYSQPIKKITDRRRNFRFKINVWGRTAVKVAIYIVGVETPIVRQRFMSLSETQKF